MSLEDNSPPVVQSVRYFNDAAYKSESFIETNSRAEAEEVCVVRLYIGGSHVAIPD